MGLELPMRLLTYKVKMEICACSSSLLQAPYSTGFVPGRGDSRAVKNRWGDPNEDRTHLPPYQLSTRVKPQSCHCQLLRGL